MVFLTQMIFQLMDVVTMDGKKMNKEKYTEATIDEFIKQYGAEYLFVNERFYENMILRLNKQDESNRLSKYFQVNIRYLWMKLGLIKPKNKKGDLLLLEKGPKYIMSKTKPVTAKKSSPLKKNEELFHYRNNARIYRGKIKHVERKFKTKYPFTCGICEKRKRYGMGFYTLCEEFFICDDCLKMYQFPLDVADKYKIIFTPMGGQNKRY